MDGTDLIQRASDFHPWDAMAPSALAGILKLGPFRASAETGCGGGTIILSQVSEHHIAFAIEGENRTITELRNRSEQRATKREPFTGDQLYGMGLHKAYGHGKIPGASHIRKIIGKPCAGKPYARFERGSLETDRRKLVRAGLLPMKTTVVALGLMLGGMCAAQKYTAQGELLLPKNYQHWDFLTSGFGMGYPEEGTPNAKPVFTNVFVQPVANREFQKKGLWPDKTVLLIEVRDSGNSAAVNKDGRFQTRLLGFEAHVKDASRGGWIFYSIGKDASSGKPIAKTRNCYSCHEKNAATDTTFVQYYPTLIEAARKHGTYKEPKE